MHKSRSSIKRSTLILDNNMVREYNLAMECLAVREEEVTPRSESQSSLDSLRSMESILSLDRSVMELYEDDELTEGKDDHDMIFFTTNDAPTKADSDWSLWEIDSHVLTRTALDF